MGYPQGRAAAGGSGGSIFLRATEFAGRGVISASGGDGAVLGGYHGGGGGGGRIALYYQTNSFSGTISVNGGSGYQNGSAGTIHILSNGVPLQISRVKPDVDGFGGNVNSLSAFFAEPIDTATIRGNSISLISAGADGVLGNADDQPVTNGVISYSGSLHQLLLVFPTGLPTNVYRATVSTSITDLAGNMLPAEFSWSFHVVGCAVTNAGLVAWWPADGTTNEIVGGYGAILGNGATFAPGFAAQAFSFDGADDVIATGSSLTSIRNTFTMEFWAFPTGNRNVTTENTSGTIGTSGQRYAIAPEGGGDGPAGAGVSVGSNGVSVFEHAGNYLPSLLVYSASIIDWTHIAVVYDNKQPKLYVNGVLVRTGLTSPRSYVFPSKLFGNVGTYGPYSGLLDEVSIYNRALSADEVLAIYRSGAAGKCKP